MTALRTLAAGCFWTASLGAVAVWVWAVFG